MWSPPNRGITEDLDRSLFLLQDLDMSKNCHNIVLVEVTMYLSKMKQGSRFKWNGKNYLLCQTVETNNPKVFYVVELEHYLVAIMTDCNVEDY